MKTIRIKQPGIKIVGLTNGIITYGKFIRNGEKPKYKLEINLPEFCVPLYLGHKKPIIRNIPVLSVLLYLPRILAVVLLVILSLFWVYIAGGINFFKNSAWIDNVREFNWANIAIIIILSILLIIK